MLHRPHRVVITGFGAITPIGNCVKSSWNSLLSKSHGIKNLLELDQWHHLNSQLKLLKCHLAAPVTDVPIAECIYDRIKTPRHFKFAEIATDEAIKCANINMNTPPNQNIGVFLGSGLPGISEMYDSFAETTKKLSPYFITSILGNSAASHVSRRFYLKGPISSPSMACATGTYSIGEAFRYLRSPDSDIDNCKIILAGGTDAPISFPIINGFNRLRALSHKSDPNFASIPFDQDRDGFIIGEGAGVLVLERLDSALERNATIFAEIVGFSCKNDSYHPTSPDPSGSAAVSTIKSALHDQDLNMLVSINAHATSTLKGDEVELLALKKALPNRTNISITSNKGAIGHLLGAAGAVETIFSVQSLYTSVISGNFSLKRPIPTPFKLPTENELIKNGNSDSMMILKTSFGFGGINTALCLKSFNNEKQG